MNPNVHVLVGWSVGLAWFPQKGRDVPCHLPLIKQYFKNNRTHREKKQRHARHKLVWLPITDGGLCQMFEIQRAPIIVWINSAVIKSFTHIPYINYAVFILDKLWKARTQRTFCGCHGRIFTRGVRAEAAFSPTFSATAFSTTSSATTFSPAFSATPFSPTFGATTKILSATPVFEVHHSCWMMGFRIIF